MINITDIIKTSTLCFNRYQWCFSWFINAKWKL